jgi:lipoate-protein ligase A
MISTFEHNAGTSLLENRIAPEELAEAEELVRTKYGTREWTYLVP